MPTQINANYSANFQKFVDFANKAYATKGEDTVVRFSGATCSARLSRTCSAARSSFPTSCATT